MLENLGVSILIPVKWLKPPTDWMKLNTDGASLGNPGAAGARGDN